MKSGSRPSIVNSGFRQTSDGQLAFYPNGFWGKGYLVPDQKKAAEIERFQKWIWLLYFVAIGLVAIYFIVTGTVGSGWLVLTIAFLALLFYVSMRWLLARKLAGLPPSPESLTFKQGCQSLAGSQTTGRIWIGVGLGAVGTLSGLIMFLGQVLGLDPVNYDRLFAGICFILFFGALGLMNGYMLYYKRQTAK